MVESSARRTRPDRSRLYGATICGIALAVAAVLVDGVRRRSYWAVAAPLLVLSLGVLSVAMWIGWTLFMTSLRPPEPLPGSPQAPHDTPPRSPGRPSAN